MLAIWNHHCIYRLDWLLLDLLVEQDICTSHSRTVSIESSDKAVIHSFHSLIINQHPLARLVILDNCDIMTVVWSTTDMYYHGIEFVHPIRVLGVVGCIEESQRWGVYDAMEEF